MYMGHLASVLMSKINLSTLFALFIIESNRLELFLVVDGYVSRGRDTHSPKYLHLLGALKFVSSRPRASRRVGGVLVVRGGCR